MGTFIVEIYLSRDAPGEPDATITRVRSAVADALNDARQTRFLRSIYVPEDETCLLLVEAAGVPAVRDMLTRAGVAADRIALADAHEGRLPDQQSDQPSG